ncbi:MAG: M1 family metallopeptidase [Flavobacteriales bacterium]|nr:M1 family metallopeptidase [Flavobacteriales bacterium]
MKLFLSTILLIVFKFSFAYLSTNPDSIRGALRLERTCYDVTFYDLKVDIDPDRKRIEGSNDIYFTAKEKSNIIQVDLFRQYKIEDIQLFVFSDSGTIFKSVKPNLERIEDAMFLSFSDSLIIGAEYKLRIQYYGLPNVAKKAPWDGGFVWSKDSIGRHFCGVACEGWGASSWWPCKDHLADEPDSMQMTFTVPLGYDCISNGNLIKTDVITEPGEIGLFLFNSYTWKVSYPINTYNVSFYLGNFDVVKDDYISGSDTLKTSFYALDYNIKKAKVQFEQVGPMLKIYEDLFGKYPFWNDGYKLVEAPYLGMEHQSGIAYGNKYKNGYLGHQPKGVDFDYIIIHESGHEYWGNSVSMQDLADMWIHESFCTYTETLYAERMYGKEVAINYLKAQRIRMSHDEPIVGEFGINQEGSGDMYNKGAWMLHTIRNVVANDSLWFKALKEFALDFKLSSTNSKEVLAWFESKLGENVKLIMERYLFSASIPVLEYKEKKMLWNKSIEYRWKNETEGFKLPIHFIDKRGDKRLVPTSEWQGVKVSSFEKVRSIFSWKYELFDIEKVEKR